MNDLKISKYFNELLQINFNWTKRNLPEPLNTKPIDSLNQRNEREYLNQREL